MDDFVHAVRLARDEDLTSDGAVRLPPSHDDDDRDSRQSHWQGAALSMLPASPMLPDAARCSPVLPDAARCSPMLPLKRAATAVEAAPMERAAAVEEAATTEEAAVGAKAVEAATDAATDAATEAATKAATELADTSTRTSNECGTAPAACQRRAIQFDSGGGAWRHGGPARYEWECEAAGHDAASHAGAAIPPPKIPRLSRAQGSNAG